MESRRSRSRSPISDRSSFEKRLKTSKKERSFPEKDYLTEMMPSIFLANLPLNEKSPNYDKVRQFVKQVALSQAVKDTVGYVEVSKAPPGFRVQFDDIEICKMAVRELRGKLINGRPIYASISTPDEHRYRHWLHEQGGGDQPRGPPPAMLHPRGPPQNMQPGFAEQPAGEPQCETYGLNIGFLKDLGIRLPLNNKIYVLGLDNTATEPALREVFGTAGIILSVVLKHKGKEGSTDSYARIEFDHPLEAVQAISMFNMRVLFGNSIRVKMDEAPNKLLVPNGLNTIGPGLGPGGKPMRDIRTNMELGRFKNQIKEEIEAIRNELANIQKSQNQNMLNQLTTQNSFGTVPNMVQGVQGQLGNDLLTVLANLQAQVAQSSMVQNALVPNPLVTNQIVPNGGIQNAMNMAQNFPQQSDWRPKGQNDSVSQFSHGSEQGYFGAQHNSSAEPEFIPMDNGARQKTSDMLMFTNLPTSVTPAALSNKMREVGELRTAEHIGDGKAIVRFMRAADAERCLKLFDRSKVDGQVIEVKAI